MQELLQKLEERLKRFRPSYLEELNQPLSSAEIDQLEQQYGVQLPPDLRLLYGWKNGQPDDCFDAFVNNSMFVPLQQALDTAQEYTSMIGSDFEIENWWNSQWIPVFHNGAGDYICYDIGGLFTGKTGQLIEFWHADNDRDVIAPDLETFLKALIRYFDTASPDADDEFFSTSEMIDGYPKQFKVE